MKFENWTKVQDRLFVIQTGAKAENQEATDTAFSRKWEVYSEESIEEQEKAFEFQREWFLELYGFASEAELAHRLKQFDFILDAGCGLGYKAAWFASLAPESTVIGIDASSSIHVAHERYNRLYPNIIFAKGDIAETRIKEGTVGFTVCDQVIMHTEDPASTLNELSRVTSPKGEVCCYWYRQKALPRELLDQYFRDNTSNWSEEELWKLSKEVLELGKMLSELNIKADFPSVPSLGIVGGEMDLQRFLYWNFMKCFWNKDLGHATSLSTNFDWYSPVNAKTFSRSDVETDLKAAGLRELFFHEEEACYSGRFSKVV